MGCSNSHHRKGDYSIEGIKDVSMMRFDEGLTRLRLNNNKIVDVSGLTLPPGLTWLQTEKALSSKILRDGQEGCE
jgi:hypothetical protein